MLGGAKSSPQVSLVHAPAPERADIELREEHGGVVIRLIGPINEHFDPARLRLAAPAPIVIIDLDSVPWITSFGVREWIRALADLAHGYLAFIRVRPIVRRSLPADFSSCSTIDIAFPITSSWAGRRCWRRPSSRGTHDVGWGGEHNQSRTRLAAIVGQLLHGAMKFAR